MNSCFKKTDILLPDFSSVDAHRWAVVACDQFTSEPKYWQEAEKIVGTAPSTLNLILPEVYLADTDRCLPKIHKAMGEYLQDVLVLHKDSAVFVERTQSDGSIRRGIVMAVDLEAYDFSKGAHSLIRATEATVVERIPPRVAVRRGACIELPHIMLLIDDRDKTVIEPTLSEPLGGLAYDTSLMLGGGHITGHFISDESFERISRALNALTAPDAMRERYGADGLSPLLFAVGDGNHSLATAKTAYEEIKAKIGAERAASHPARYALVEVVNIHDEALKFEPIYRVMFGVKPAEVLCELEKYVSSLDGNAQPQSIEFIHRDGEGTLSVAHPTRQLTVGTLQDFIDSYIATHEGASVDYIHGIQSTKTLASEDGAIGFLFTGMTKAELFKTVIFDGALPRKTFSMGHAEDKRYYMEAAKITLD